MIKTRASYLLGSISKPQKYP